MARSSVRSIGLTLAVVALLTTAILPAGGCASSGQADLSKLSIEGRQNYYALQATKIVHDAVTGIASANRVHLNGEPILSDHVTGIVLRALDGVLKVIEVNPKGYLTVAETLLETARSELTTDERLKVGPYLEPIDALLKEVRQ